MAEEKKNQGFEIPQITQTEMLKLKGDILFQLFCVQQVLKSTYSANSQKSFKLSTYLPSNTALVLFVMQSQHGASESVVTAENCNSEGLHVGRRYLECLFSDILCRMSSRNNAVFSPEEALKSDGK